MKIDKKIKLILPLVILSIALFFQNCATDRNKLKPCGAGQATCASESDTNQLLDKLNPSVDISNVQIISVKKSESSPAQFETCYLDQKNHLMCVSWSQRKETHDELETHYHILSKENEVLAVSEDSEFRKKAIGNFGTEFLGEKNQFSNYFAYSKTAQNKFSVKSLANDESHNGFNLTDLTGEAQSLFFANIDIPVLCFAHSSGFMICSWFESSHEQAIKFPITCEIKQNEDACKATDFDPSQSESLFTLLGNLKPEGGPGKSLLNANGPNNETQKDTLNGGPSTNSTESKDKSVASLVYFEGTWEKGKTWSSTCLSTADYRDLVLKDQVFAEGSPCYIKSQPAHGNTKFQAQCSLAGSLPGVQCSEGDTGNYYCTSITSWTCD